MKDNYQNEIYWKEKLKDCKDNDIDFLSDIWLEKYSSLVNSINKGKALDLGCGLGQYTKYLSDLGFDVVSCDISLEALEKLNESIECANTICLDMREPLSFLDETFELVFANLSIQYFDKETTINLLNEIRRILKNGGYFIGNVNSIKTFPNIKDVAEEVEPYFYCHKNGKCERLWDEEQIKLFLKDFSIIELNENTTKRWNKTKVMWKFIARKK